MQSVYTHMQNADAMRRTKLLENITETGVRWKGNKASHFRCPC